MKTISNKQWVIAQVITTLMSLGIYFLVFSLKGGWSFEGKELIYVAALAGAVNLVVAVTACAIFSISAFSTAFSSVARTLAVLAIAALAVGLVAVLATTAVNFYDAVALNLIYATLSVAVFIACDFMFIGVVIALAIMNLGDKLPKRFIWVSLTIEFFIIAGAMSLVFVL